MGLLVSRIVERHWLDTLVDNIVEKLKEMGVSNVIVNGGLSVSGLQHIGRLRGEILLAEAVRRELEKRGYNAKQYLTLYTMDPWKGKREQREAFPDPEQARAYTGWPLIYVPDPQGCHASWVDHFWSDFGPYIGEFTDGRIEVVYTHDMYRGVMKPFVLEVIDKREKVIDVVNKYRGRKPYPKTWIPIEPVCQSCRRIDTTHALKVDGERVWYRCSNCGYAGETTIENGKLNWRIEWVGVWKSLNVIFEPYGKDHATPGGSRDSCVDLAVNVFGFTPPIGEWYEWVAIRVGDRESDMSSSGFTGITPREWLEIAHPQILRFIFFSTHPHRKIVIDLQDLPRYYEEYYKAERVYFGLEEGDAVTKRTYELSHPREPPQKPPAQIPYTHAAILAQILPEDKLPDEAIKRLRRTGHLPEDADDYSIQWTLSLIKKAGTWARRYAPGSYRIEIPREIPVEILESLKYGSLLAKLADKLESLDTWDEDSIKEAMIEVGKDLTSKQRREFYKDFYKVMIGKPYGPRAAPLLSLMSKEWVIQRLRKATKEED